MSLAKMSTRDHQVQGDLRWPRSQGFMGLKLSVTRTLYCCSMIVNLFLKRRKKLHHHVRSNVRLGFNFFLSSLWHLGTDGRIQKIPRLNFWPALAQLRLFWIDKKMFYLLQCFAQNAELIIISRQYINGVLLPISISIWLNPADLKQQSVLSKLIWCFRMPQGCTIKIVWALV